MVYLLKGKKSVVEPPHTASAQPRNSEGSTCSLIKYSWDSRQLNDVRRVASLHTCIWSWFWWASSSCFPLAHVAETNAHWRKDWRKDWSPLYPVYLHTAHACKRMDPTLVRWWCPWLTGHKPLNVKPIRHAAVIRCWPKNLDKTCILTGAIKLRDVWPQSAFYQFFFSLFFFFFNPVIYWY